MNHRIASILIIALQLAIFPAHAGPVRTWKPNELFERSEIVIIGQAFEIEATGKKGSIQLGGGRILPTVFYTAKVRVVEVIKGDDLQKDTDELRVKAKVKAISVTYSIIDEAKVVDPHYVHRFSLQDDKLFLLYLNSAKDGGYIAALDGEIDDYQAAKPLGIQIDEQGGADQPANAHESKSEGKDKTQPESKAAPR